MAMINPYALAQSQKTLMDSILESEGIQQKTKEKTAGHMGELEDAYESQMAALQAQAEAELRKQRPEERKSKKQRRREKWAKGLGGLGKAFGFIPGVGSAWSSALGGLSTGLSSYVQGMHGRDMSIADKNWAMQQAGKAKSILGRIDPKFKRLFTKSRAKTFETEGQSFAQSLLDEAKMREIGSKSDIVSDSLSQAGKSALSSFVMDKAMKKGMESMKEMKGLKEATGMKKGQFKKLGKELSEKGIEFGDIKPDLKTSIGDMGQVISEASYPSEISNILSSKDLSALSNLTDEQFEALVGGQGLFKGLLAGQQEGTDIISGKSDLLSKLLMGGSLLYNQ